MPQKKPALAGLSGPFSGASRDMFGPSELSLLQNKIEHRKATRRKAGLAEEGDLKPAKASKGILTQKASKAVEAGSKLLGRSERQAAQDARSFEDFSNDWNPLSAVDMLGTQAGYAATGNDKFRGDALKEGALNLALEAGGAVALPALKKAVPALRKALVNNEVTKPIVRALERPGVQIEKPLAGAPAWFKDMGYIGPSPGLREAARDYAKAAGIDYKPPEKYLDVDPERASAISRAFGAMVDDPSPEDVTKAYAALASETIEQYKALRKQGYEFDFYPDDGSNPYPNPWDAIRDLRDNRRMMVYPTSKGYGEGPITPEKMAANPMLQYIPDETWSGQPVFVNDAFRAVHDAFGHAKDGVGFRAAGEENAWASHMPMFSPEAQRALTSETRGQNSALNFGEHGEANRTAKTEDTKFSPQKIGLLPQWTLDPQGLPPSADWTTDTVEDLISRKEGSNDTFVAHMSPSEFLGLTASKQGREALHTTDSLGEFDPELYQQSGPITLGVQFGGEPSNVQKGMGVTQLPSLIMEHDGRHRMAALERQGVDKVPVLIRGRNKSAPRALDEEIKLTPQRGRLSTLNNGDTPAYVRGLTPLKDYKKP